MDQNQQAQKNGESLASGGVMKAIDSGRGGILGVKAGMTQVFGESGNAIAVTVIDLRPNRITQLKTNEKNGYVGIQVGMDEKKAKHSNKAEQGHVAPVGAKGFRILKEFRLPADASLDGFAVGESLSPEFVKAGDFVDITSISKGKGFQGVMKRYHFAGGFRSHGASLSHRQIGSIGNRADPGKVFKNKKMAGQMGNEKVTIQNVRVVRVDLEKQVLLVHGSVPGPRTSVVTIRRAVK